MQWSAQFQWDGLTGDVQVECVPNVDPAAYATVADDGLHERQGLKGLPINSTEAWRWTFADRF